MQGKCFTCGSPAFFSQHEEFYADVDDEFTDNPFKIFFLLGIISPHLNFSSTFTSSNI